MKQTLHAGHILKKYRSMGVEINTVSEKNKSFNASFEDNRHTGPFLPGLRCNPSIRLLRGRGGYYGVGIDSTGASASGGRGNGIGSLNGKQFSKCLIFCVQSVQLGLQFGGVSLWLFCHFLCDSRHHCQSFVCRHCRSRFIRVHSISHAVSLRGHAATTGVAMTHSSLGLVCPHQIGDLWSKHCTLAWRAPPLIRGWNLNLNSKFMVNFTGWATSRDIWQNLIHQKRLSKIVRCFNRVQIHKFFYCWAHKWGS